MTNTACCAPIPAAQALETLDQLADAANPVALLLSDQRMPEMDGVTFLKQARKRFPDSKRALLTAYADTDAAIAAINESQVDYYLTKPWDPPDERLYPFVDDLLDDWKAHHKLGYGGVRIIGSRWMRESHEMRDFLARNQVPYTFLDVEHDDEAKRLAAEVKDHQKQLPLVILTSGEKLYAPTTAQLAERLGLQTAPAAQIYDFAIVGGGPAGLAAAVYGASEGLKHDPDRTRSAGRPGRHVEPHRELSRLPVGPLRRRPRAPRRDAGPPVQRRDPVAAGDLRAALRRAVQGAALRRQRQGDQRQGADAGHRRRVAQAARAERRAFDGRGIYYGAGDDRSRRACRRRRLRRRRRQLGGPGRRVFSRTRRPRHHGRARQVARREDVAVSGRSAGVAAERGDPAAVARSPTVTATSTSKRITIRNRATNETEQVRTRYLFVFIGADPNTAWLNTHVALDDHGFILTGTDIKPEQLKDWPLERAPYLLEASVPGVFAAGDVRHESIKRVASAVGEGSVAVHFMHRYLAAS